VKPRERLAWYRAVLQSPDFPFFKKQGEIFLFKQGNFDRIISISMHVASLYRQNRHDAASSYPIGVILLVAITFLLALLVLLMLQFQPFALNMETEIPKIFTITSIKSVDEITGHLNYDSRVLLLNTGKAVVQNKNIKARFLKNGQPVTCTIATMNGHDFISTSHIGVQWMGGSGCSGATWSPGEQICIDFSDGTYHPGDSIQMDIIDKTTNVTISRHVYRYE
jgi:hypothetical protein